MTTTSNQRPDAALIEQIREAKVLSEELLTTCPIAFPPHTYAELAMAHYELCQVEYLFSTGAQREKPLMLPAALAKGDQVLSGLRKAIEDAKKAKVELELRAAALRQTRDSGGRRE